VSLRASFCVRGFVGECKFSCELPSRLQLKFKGLDVAIFSIASDTNHQS